jgi:Transglycosylase SLT domain
LKQILILALFITAMWPLKAGNLTCFQIPEFRAPVQLVEHIAKKYGRQVQDIENIVLVVQRKTMMQGFPTALDALAVIAVESEFNSKAEHPVGPSQGLMQINIGAHKVSNMKDPLVNISKGLEILREYRKKAGSDSRALVFYNAGPGRGLEICPSRSCSTEYVEKVQRVKRELQLHLRS